MASPTEKSGPSGLLHTHLPQSVDSDFDIGEIDIDQLLSADDVSTTYFDFESFMQEHEHTCENGRLGSVDNQPTHLDEQYLGRTDADVHYHWQAPAINESVGFTDPSLAQERGSTSANQIPGSTTSYRSDPDSYCLTPTRDCVFATPSDDILPNEMNHQTFDRNQSFPPSVTADSLVQSHEEVALDIRLSAAASSTIANSPVSTRSLAPISERSPSPLTRISKAKRKLSSTICGLAQSTAMTTKADKTLASLAGDAYSCFPLVVQSGNLRRSNVRKENHAQTRSKPHAREARVSSAAI